MLPRKYNPIHWRKIAYRDTHGLKNRAWLLDTAARLYESKKASWSFLLLYIDLKNFKQVNDKLSHTDGNKVLVEFYELLESMIRKKSAKPETFKVSRRTPEADILVVREGGDEFAGFLPLGQCGHEDVEKARHSVEKRVKNLKVVHKGIEVTARVAVLESTPENHYESFGDYFEAADRLLSAVRASEQKSNY